MSAKELSGSRLDRVKRGIIGPVTIFDQAKADEALQRELDRVTIGELVRKYRARILELAPPVFAFDLDWPAIVAGSVDGPHAWKLLVDAVGNLAPQSALVSTSAWDSLLVHELIRRASLAKACGVSGEVALADRLLSQDFWHWLAHHAWIENPHRGGAHLLPFVPWPSQVAVLLWLIDFLDDATPEALSCAVNKSRSLGVSWLMMQLFAWRLMFSQGFSALCGSIGEAEADDGTTESLLGKLVMILENQRPWILEPDGWEAKKLHVSVGANKVRAEAMNEHFGRSGRVGVVFLDERASVRQRLQAATTRALTSVGHRLIEVSTPSGRDEEFYNHAIGLPRERSLVCHWSADPRRDVGWFDRLLIKNGGRLTQGARDQQYACSYDAIVSRTVFVNTASIAYDDTTPEWRSIMVDMRQSGTLFAGADFGGGISATPCRFCFVDWSAPLQIAGEWWPRFWWDLELHTNGMRPADFAAAVKAASTKEYRRLPWKIFCDPTGIADTQGQNTAWITALQRGGLPAVAAISTANRAGDKDAALATIDMLMANGLWRVHAKRSPMGLWSERNWSRNIPDGVPLAFVTSAAALPKKDGPSHSCEAAMYCASEYLRLFAQQPRLGLARRATS